MDCMEELEQMSVDTTLVSVESAITDGEEYVHTSLTSQLNQFIPPSNKNIAHGTLENTKTSVEDNVERSPPAEKATSVQYCESNVNLKEPNSSRPSPDMNINLDSLLGYPNTKASFEHQQSITIENTTTPSARDIGVQQSLCGLESTPLFCTLSRPNEPVKSTFNKSCIDIDRSTLSFKSNIPLIGQTNSEYEVCQVGKNEIGLSLTCCNSSDESDSSESSPWWLNLESDISMADVHRAVSEFITPGKEFCVQSLKIKEEFVPASIYDNRSTVWDPNCLENESTCSKFLTPNSVPMYREVGEVSIVRNESCVLHSRPERRENLPVVLLGNGSNTLVERDEKYRPSPSKSSSLELTPLDPPLVVDNKWVDVYWVRNGAMYTCYICDKIYSQCETVRDHVRTHLGIQPYACRDSYCRETFTSLYKLGLHMRNCHGWTNETTHRPTVVCLESDARIPSVSNTGEDSFSNVKTCQQTKKSKLTCYPCLKCGKKFKRLQWLKRHEVVHSCRCQSCGLDFRSNYDRNSHFKTCLYRSHFTLPLEQTCTNQDVTKHKKVVYIKKRFQCNECDLKFTKVNYLTDHVCFSRGVDLYTCDICSDTFVQRSYLIRHLRNHSPS